MKGPATTHDSFSKQACTILYVSPGYLESIQSFFKDYRLKAGRILGD